MFSSAESPRSGMFFFLQRFRKRNVLYCIDAHIGAAAMVYLCGQNHSEGVVQRSMAGLASTASVGKRMVYFSGVSVNVSPL